MKLIAATNNQGKVKEIKSILGGLGFDVVSLRDMEIDIEIEENGETFEENALIKARTIALLTKHATIADDSGLCVDALGGAPGVYSARYAGEGASDKMLVCKLLSNMKDVPENERGAHFVSAVALVLPDGREYVVRGSAGGHITYEPDGDGGFGYDPVFCSDETGRTYARMSAEEKNAISHRFRALMELEKLLKKEKIDFENA